MKRRYIYILIALVFLVILYIPNISYRDKDTVIKHINDKDLTSVNLEDFMMKAIGKPFWYPDDKYMIEKFVMGLTENNEIRTITCYITSESLTSNRRYRIYYNKDTNYFKINEDKNATEVKSNVQLRGFLNVFDSIKDNFVKNEGHKYDYYQVRLLSPSEISLNIVTDNFNAYIWDNGHLRDASDNKELDGVILSVHGEPIQKETNSITYYVIEN